MKRLDFDSKQQQQQQQQQQQMQQQCPKTKQSCFRNYFYLKTRKRVKQTMLVQLGCVSTQEAELKSYLGPFK